MQIKLNTEGLLTPNSIRTFTGKWFNITNITPDTICIEDIAHALSMQPRFAGHLYEKYSVAQHSVFCATHCHRYPLTALLHDASEAYLCDIASPFKQYMTGYKELENRVMQVIAKKFGIFYPFPHEVKEVDAFALEVEWHTLVMNGDPCYGILPSQSPVLAKERFLSTFQFLTT